MTATGIELRLNRISRDGRYVMIPMDHGLTLGPTRGLDTLEATIETVSANGADAVVLHRGNLSRTLDAPPGLGRIVHLNGATSLTPEPNDKRTVCSVESALTFGADAVSFHLNVGSRYEGRQLEELGSAIEQAHAFGLPVLAMAYPRGPDTHEDDPTHVAHAVRLAAELDADVIKTSYPGSGFDQAVDAVDTPVIIAGGTPAGDLATLESVAAAMSAGAVGVSMGRTIFQHDDPGAMTAAVAAIVHDGATAESAQNTHL